MKLLFVFGTRPEAIKMAPVVRALDRFADRIRTVVCVTAQHREMLDQILRLFDIVPAHDLEVMQDNQTPAQVAAAVLARLERVLAAERPDWVLVQGDTTTTATAALAAFYARIKVAHVEAGLRSGDRFQPFPEEINRRVASVVADLHLAPTARARRNLLQEHVDESSVLVTGNTVIDALRWVAEHRRDELSRVALPVPDREGTRLIFMTAHRRENFGAPLESVCQAVREVAQRLGDRVHFLYPVHPNPNVRGPVGRLLSGLANVTLTDPLGYVDTVRALQRAYLVLTDSGGLQEEAPTFGLPTLVLRDVTERPEAIEAGTAALVGTDRQRIVASVTEMLEDRVTYERMARAVNPFGDGRASERIIAALLGEPVQGFEPVPSSAATRSGLGAAR